MTCTGDLMMVLPLTGQAPILGVRGVRRQRAPLRPGRSQALGAPLQTPESPPARHEEQHQAEQQQRAEPCAELPPPQPTHAHSKRIELVSALWVLTSYLGLGLLPHL